ncbi:hypothetical protein MRX96_058596 [Rhipicephalus microplus]
METRHKSSPNQGKQQKGSGDKEPTFTYSERNLIPPILLEAGFRGLRCARRSAFPVAPWRDEIDKGDTFEVRGVEIHLEENCNPTLPTPGADNALTVPAVHGGWAGN